MNKLFNNLCAVFSNMFSQFEDPDKIRIGDKEIHFYKNYYLKGIKHKDFL